MNPQLLKPTVREFLRQRVCAHRDTVAHCDDDFGEATRCNDCGYTVWTDPADLEERVRVWTRDHTTTITVTCGRCGGPLLQSAGYDIGIGCPKCNGNAA